MTSDADVVKTASMTQPLNVDDAAANESDDAEQGSGGRRFLSVNRKVMSSVAVFLQGTLHYLLKPFTLGWNSLYTFSSKLAKVKQSWNVVVESTVRMRWMLLEAAAGAPCMTHVRNLYIDTLWFHRLFPGWNSAVVLIDWFVFFPRTPLCSGDYTFTSLPKLLILDVGSIIFPVSFWLRRFLILYFDTFYVYYCKRLC